MSTQRTEILRDLGDGLIIRRATRADALAVATLNAIVHRDQPTHVLIRELIDGPHPHPHYGASDFTVVEDTATGELVSSLCVVGQRWWYEDVPLVVGQPEYVGTLEHYRRKGLIRAQFDVIHQWGRQRGEHLQAILGIPWYYRQFGYEMALEAEEGRSIPAGRIRSLGDGQTEPFRLRPAVETDLPFVAATYDGNRSRWLLSVDRALDIWRYDLLHRPWDKWTTWQIHVVETAEGRPVGFVMPSDHLRGSWLPVNAVELQPGVSWLAAAPSILRGLRALAEPLAAKRVDGRFDGISFRIGSGHPFYQAVEGETGHHGAYAWYIRVADIPGFLTHTRPVLERRLAGSVAVGHTGEVKISFYRSGVRLALVDGRLEKAEPWQPGDDHEEADAGFPDLTFLQLLMGYRSLDELRASFPDCWVHRHATKVLLDVLFPKRPSRIVAVQ